MKLNKFFLPVILLMLIIQSCARASAPDEVATSVAGTLTALPSPSIPSKSTVAPTAVDKQPATAEPLATAMPMQTTIEPAPSVVGTGGIDPYPSAPLCSDTGDAHDNSLFHTLWDSIRGCHYDHEHGTDPFIPEVAEMFPGFDLRALIGGVGVGHTNPSSPMENTHKHGGFKWDVNLSHSGGCVGGEGATIGIDAAVIQYHNFGDYSIEFEARVHSGLALMRQCLANNPDDYGYIFVNQHLDYGQRVAPYQGMVLEYPDRPNPGYNSSSKPYFTIECIGGLPPCNKYPTLVNFLERKMTADSLWVSEPQYLTESGSTLFSLLFKVRDIYQVLDWTDQTYPYTFRWLCSSDGGETYNPVGCRYNNSTSRVQQVKGTIPSGWDNMRGFDTDETIGRITAEGYVTKFGDLNPNCTAPGTDCHPIKLVRAFVGTYGSLFYNKSETASINSKPERDIYFCGEQVCNEGDPGAVPSGWIGTNN